MNHCEEEVLTSPLGPSEGLNIHCTVEVFDNSGQVPLHVFDRAQVDQSANRFRCSHQRMPNVAKAIAYRV